MQEAEEGSFLEAFEFSQAAEKVTSDITVAEGVLDGVTEGMFFFYYVFMLGKTTLC